MSTRPHHSPFLCWLFAWVLALGLTACGSGSGSAEAGGVAVPQTGGAVAGGALAGDTPAGATPPAGTTAGGTAGGASAGGTTAGGAGAVSAALPSSPLASNSVVAGTILPGTLPSVAGTGVGTGTGTDTGAGTGGTGTLSGGSAGSAGLAGGPMIVSSNPTQGAVNVPLSIVGANNTLTPTLVSATFSEAMNPVGLSTPATVFTLHETASGQNVAGRVSLNASSTVATLLPSATLTPNTQYTASVSVVASSATGTPLVSTYAWLFTTGASGAIGQAAIDLGATAAFLALGGTAIDNTSTAEQPTRVNGQLGVYQTSPTVVTGFTDSRPEGSGIILTGGIQTNPATTQVEADFRKAMQEATSRTLNPTRTGISDLALTLVDGVTPGVFPPGLYTSGSAALVLDAGNLTLDAQGNPDAVWLFKADSTFTVGDNRQIILINGARASHVFWLVGSSVTVGDQVVFKGNILAGSSITLGSPALTGTTLEGRAMSASSLNFSHVTLDKPLP